MRMIRVVPIVVLSCQPASVSNPVPGGSASASGAVSPVPPPIDRVLDQPLPPTPDPSTSTTASESTPTVVPPGPSGPASLEIEYQIYDHRISLSRLPPRELILDHISVDLVVHSEPKQRITIGSFQNENCMFLPAYPPSLPELSCSFNGLVGSVELKRIHGDQVRVDAVEGPDGLDAPGLTRAWTAGTVSIPEGVPTSGQTVDRDEQMRSGSKQPPVAVTFRKGVHGARLDVGTTPSQSFVVPGWDPSGCKLHSQLDMARIAFVDCSTSNDKSLLLAYVGHETAEAWLVKRDSHFTGGLRRVVGRVRIPRDRPLDVTMKQPASSGP